MYAAAQNSKELRGDQKSEEWQWVKPRHKEHRCTAVRQGTRGLRLLQRNTSTTWSYGCKDPARAGTDTRGVIHGTTRRIVPNLLEGRST